MKITLISEDLSKLTWCREHANTTWLTEIPSGKTNADTDAVLVDAVLGDASKIPECRVIVCVHEDRALAATTLRILKRQQPHAVLAWFPCPDDSGRLLAHILRHQLEVTPTNDV